MGRATTSTAFFRKKTDGIAGLSLSAIKIEDRRRTYGLHRRSSVPQAVKQVKDISLGYLTSYPPPSKTGSNGRVHRPASSLLKDKGIAHQGINELRGCFTHHLEGMKAASEYKNIMGLSVNCNYYDFEAWERSAQDGGGGKTARGESKKWLNYVGCRYIIDGVNLFSKPISGQGWEYIEPYKYQAAACVECGLDEEIVKMAVLKVIAGKSSSHHGV